MTVIPEPELTPEDVRAIAKDAYIYGYPLLDNYRVLYSYFVDQRDPEFKAPWNVLFNNARVFTADDTAIQTVNSDTPYSDLGADLRTEPLVITVPPIDGDRYFSLQFIDLYTFNFAYVGSRATGNGGGSYLLTGPGWAGDVPAGIDAVIPCETALAFVLYRTQLFGPDDIDNVKAVQAGYHVQPLSAFLGAAPPPQAPAIDFMPPLSNAEERTSPHVFDELNFLLQFCPTHPSERALMERFARIGVGAGMTFAYDAQSPEFQQAILDGMAEAWLVYDGVIADMVSGKVGSDQGFGTREFLQNNYPYRMAAAADGIYGNSRDEALYPMYMVDADGNPFDGAAHRYQLRFAPGSFPPVKSFWSLTMYSHPQSLLVHNVIDRYLINSAMLPDLVKDADGGVTLIIQHDPPGKELEANWLPAPDGPFRLVLRMYWPEPAALDGTWRTPPVERVN